jgi:hypothetical protein
VHGIAIDKRRRAIDPRTIYKLAIGADTRAPEQP